MNMSNKYIATIFGLKPHNISNMVNLTSGKYNKETYLKYRDKFKKLEEKDKDRNFGYIPVYDGKYNESFFESKDTSIKRAIHLFRYLCAKTDERILTTDKPIKVSFRQCEKLHICLSMSYNGKLYEREYYCTNFGVSDFKGITFSIRKRCGFLEIKGDFGLPLIDGNGEIVKDYENAPAFQYSLSVDVKGYKIPYKCRRKEIISLKESYQYGTDMEDFDLKTIFYSLSLNIGGLK